MAEKESFTVGDRVRFTRFGEWLDGEVVQVDKGLVCIRPDVRGAVQWRHPAVHEVVKA